MLSDEQLAVTYHPDTFVFSPAHMAGLRAVEAAVRADMQQSIIEAEVRGGAEYLQANQELASELAAAQAVIAEAQHWLSFLNPNGRDAKELGAILSQSPTDALQAHDRQVAAKALTDAADRVYEEWPGGTGEEGLGVEYAENWLNARAAAIVSELPDGEN